VDFSGPVKRGEFVVQHARQQHEAEGGEADLAGRCRRLRARFMHRLQHGGILPAKSRAAMFLSARNFLLQKSHWRIEQERV
jgi:hypothetical protein